MPVSDATPTTIPAVALAARHPNRVSSLLLWNGLLDGREAFADQGARELFRLMGKASAPAVAGQTYVGALGITGKADELREHRDMIVDTLGRHDLSQRIMFRGLVESDSTEERKDSRLTGFFLDVSVGLKSLL